MGLIIHNPDTGETRTLEQVDGKYAMPRAPWRVQNTGKNVVREQKRTEAKHVAQSELATLATDWGLPIPAILNVARWLLGKNCPFCQVGTEFLQFLREGKVNRNECKELVTQVLNAKSKNDREALMRLRGRLEMLRNERK